MPAPEVIKSIPYQIVNERAAFGPFDLKDYIQAPDGSSLQFSAALRSGMALPKGMICTADGLLTGIPAKGTEGNYEIIVTAENDEGSVEAEVVLTIKPIMEGSPESYFDKIKSQIWEALDQNLPIPDLGDLYARDITPTEIQYMLERWGILIVWDAFNLEPAGEKKLLTLSDASEYYNVYDRGSCLVAAPKDLYTHERTLLDGIKTSQAMAREAYSRNWTVELAGIYKLTRAFWQEFQHLGDEHGKRLEIINYTPTEADIKLYQAQAIEKGLDKKFDVD